MIDVPQPFDQTERYCASLGHKANHSFTPNCKYDPWVHTARRRGEKAAASLKYICMNISNCFLTSSTHQRKGWTQRCFYNERPKVTRSPSFTASALLGIYLPTRFLMWSWFVVLFLYFVISLEYIFLFAKGRFGLLKHISLDIQMHLMTTRRGNLSRSLTKILLIFPQKLRKICGSKNVLCSCSTQSPIST